jgi:hypothetical protein
LPAAFADNNIDKHSSVYYWFARPQTVVRTGRRVSRQPVKLAIGREPGYPLKVPEYKFTEYFEKEVLRKRAYLKNECAFEFWKNR